ncbi:MAG: hypothetical protein ACRETD_06575 [Steroidobacteraceae bacterium]
MMLGTFVAAQPFFNDAVTGVPVQVKAGAGQLFALKLVNTTAATAYLQIFDLLAAGVTLGTTPAKFTLRLAANESVTIPMFVPLGLGQLNDGAAGISMAGTTTAAGSTGAAISVSALFE